MIRNALGLTKPTRCNRWAFVALIALALTACVLRAAEDPPPLPILATPVTLDATSGTVADAVAACRAAGFDVDASAVAADTPCPVAVKNVPFWEALEAVADATRTRIELRDHGRRVALVKRDGEREPSCVRGPFRFVARQVAGRLDLTTGRSFQEVQLDVHWEPRFPVFRIDSVPTLTAATDDVGTALTLPGPSAMSPVTGASSHTLPVRLPGVPRKATKLTRLAGHVTVTASERMLPFTFDLGGKLPVEGTLPGGLRSPVRAVLKGWKAETLDGLRLWEAEVGLSYPAGLPAFQSFETWLGENRLRLVSPGRAAFAPDQVEEPAPGREMTAVYRFDAAKANGAGRGWSLVYETPAPPVDFRVPFELRDVPLP